MDYRCPVCRADLGKRKFTQAIVAQMEIVCAHCNSTLQLNVHRAEQIVVLLAFAAMLVLGVVAYRSQSQSLALAAFAAAMLGALAIPVLERIYLRSWPRYVAGARRPE